MKVKPKIEEKKYPTGRPLLKPGRARRDYSITSDDREKWPKKKKKIWR